MKSTAQQVAESLADKFMREGAYVASSGLGSYASSGVGAIGAGPAAVAVSGIDEAQSFAGLAIQSVGFEDALSADEQVVHIYVTRGSQRAFSRLPRQVDNVKIKIDKMGLLVVRPESASGKTNRGFIFTRNGRIACGSSCAPTSENLSGTIGAIVKKKGSSGQYLLSNNHVFAGCNHTAPGMPILSPSTMDGHPHAPAPTEVARHSEIVELRSGSPSFVPACQHDAALAAVTDQTKLTSWQGNDSEGYDTPTVMVQPSSGMKVKKFGRTTELTIGTVESHITSPTPIKYDSKHFKGTVYFSDIWTVRADPGGPFALGGDSGSLVVNEDASAAVGLLFAANPLGDYGWIIPIGNVVQLFSGISLVDKHGV